MTDEHSSADAAALIRIPDEAGSEAAVHAIRDMFDDDDCEAALLVEATNAFNCVNREAALQNISVLCLGLSPHMIVFHLHPQQRGE